MTNSGFWLGRYGRITVSCGLVLLLTALVGCGDSSDLAPVSGRVTVNGQPVPGLEVVFTSLDHEMVRPSSGTCDANGNYRLMFTLNEAGAMVGRNQVSFVAPVDPEEGTESVAIPPEYSEESTVEYTVTPGPNTNVDFDLEIP